MPTQNFHSLGLPLELLHSLEAMRFHTPTPIQIETIPHALQGADILGSAQTGTGKTAAYGIPVVSYLLNSNENACLILVPTRELASQVYVTLRQLLGAANSIKSALLIGGDSMHKQLNQLQKKPRLIVGTPGRINDHLKRKSLNLSNAGFLVLDETDRMLDMGFAVQLAKIAPYLPSKRQTLMFSATMAPGVAKIAASYLNNPIRISIGSTSSPVEKIKQEIVRTSELDKYGILLDQLNLSNGSFVIFVKTKSGTEKLATKLRISGHQAAAIHGDLRQRCRERTIKNFRDMKHRILVATDIAARGLDIPHIECVVNYDLPQCPEDYIHRIGRTGRAGAEGKAISLVTSQDNLKWKNICKLLNPDEKFDSPKSDTGNGYNKKRNNKNKFNFRRKRK